MQWKGIDLELIFLWMSPYVWSDYHRGIGVLIFTSTLLLLTPPLLAYWLNLWSQGPWSLVELRKQALTLTATGHPIHSYGSSKRIVWWFILKHWKISRKINGPLSPQVWLRPRQLCLHPPQHGLQLGLPVAYGHSTRWSSFSKRKTYGCSMC